ncbi:MAG: protein phosphatase 2C domain-containing protein [Fimbriimonadia bacterium]
MRCSCGADNEPIARFCANCGAELEEPTQELDLPDLGGAEPPPLHTIPTIRVAAKTDLGKVRENNEDKFEFYQPDDPAVIAARGSAFVVCDGMGGAAAGQIASELACKTFIESYYRSKAPYFADAAAYAVREAARYVCDVAEAVRSRQGMGSTLTALLVCQDRALVAHVGDSRCYRLSGEVFERVTTDHTLVEESVRSGLMSPAEAEHSPLAHVITRAIGTDRTTEPDLYSLEVHPGDRFLLCSDGLTNHVTDEEIRGHMTTHGPSEACRRLVALALERGGSDNCTVLIAEVATLCPADTPAEGSGSRAAL